MVQRDEAQAAHGDELRLAGIMERDQLDVVQAAGQLAEVHGTVELVAGRHRDAHRRPHPRIAGGAALGIADGSGERGIFFGDLIPTRWQLPIRWTSAYDDYPIEAVEIRRELVNPAADEGWWCYFTHDPGEQPIQIEATEKGFIVRAE